MGLGLLEKESNGNAWQARDTQEVHLLRGLIETTAGLDKLDRASLLAALHPLEVASPLEAMEANSEQAVRAVYERLLRNLPEARAQWQQYLDADEVVIEVDCPDCRVRFMKGAEMQRRLSTHQGKKVAVVPVGAFGAGIDLGYLRQKIALCQADGKKVSVVFMPHTKDADTTGCGAVAAYAASAQGQLFPTMLTDAVECSIQGEGTTAHVQGLQRLADQVGVPTVVVLYAHGDRGFVGEPYATPGAENLAAFFSPQNPDLAWVEAELGMPPGVDVSSQNTQLAVVEIGTALLGAGGMAVLADGDGSVGSDAFTVHAEATIAAIKRMLAAVMYPRFARVFHRDFQSTETLLISCPPELQALVEIAWREVCADLENYARTEKLLQEPEDPHHPRQHDLTYYPYVVLANAATLQRLVQN